MRIVIAGYYGYRNWGDEGSLATLLQALIPIGGSNVVFQPSPPYPFSHAVGEGERASRRTRSVPLSHAVGEGLGVREKLVIVLSGDPAFTQATYGVQAVPRMDLRAVRQAIRDSDALIFGGGSLLQDATSLRSLLYYLALIRWGLKAHGRVLLVGQGVGPLHRPLSRWLTRATLRRVPFLSVRDADSARLLSRIGVSHATVDADLTWALASQPPHIELDKDARWIGLAPRAWRDAPVREAFAALCRQIHADGYRALLIPMQENQDRSLCESIASESGALVLPAPAHPAQLLGVMTALDGMVAMRLHGAIFAASQGVPTLCIAYDPKVDALATQLSAPRVRLESLGSELLPAWQGFLQERDALRQQLQQSAPSLRCAVERLLQRVESGLGC